MIRIGTAGVPASSEKPDSLSGIRRLHELGLDAMELEFVRGVHMGSQTAKKAGETAKENNVSLSVHAPYFINLASREKDKRNASITRIIDSAVIGWEAGARIVVFHPGFYMGDERAAHERILESVAEIRDSLDEGGFDILLGPETMGKKKQYGKKRELLDLAQSVRGVQPVIDWCHLHALSDGGLQSVDDFKAVIEYFRRKLTLNKFHMHASGVEYSGGNEKRHLPLSSCEPDYRLLARALGETGVDATIICESPLLEEDALILKGLVKEFSGKDA